MQIKDLVPWSRKSGAAAPRDGDDNPFHVLQRDINRVFESFWDRFDDSFGGLERKLGRGAPRVDVAETDNAVEVTAELPGMDEKDIEVSLTDDVLSIKGEKKAERQETKKGYYVSERSYGSFYRAIPLPPGVATDDAKAEFKKGVLTITLPKTAEAQAKVKKVPVEAA